MYKLLFSRHVPGIACAAGLWLGLGICPPFARDNGQWEGQEAATLKWFQRLMQPDNPEVSCCGEADAYEADMFEVEGDHYVAIITAHRSTAAMAIPLGTRISVPNTKMKWDQGNPTGHGILFIGSQKQIFCYVTPSGI